MSKPLRPQDIAEARQATIPDFVIEAVNYLLAKKVSGGRATLSQLDIVTEVLARAPEGTTRDEIYDQHWLDFEPVYEASGWAVRYDKPGYNETYDPSFVFKAKS